MKGGSTDVLHIPRGEAGSDLGQHMPLSSPESLHTHITSSTPISLDNIFASTNGSLDHPRNRDDHFLTDANTLPGFSALAQDPGASISDPPSIDQMTLGYDYTSVDGVPNTSLSNPDRSSDNIGTDAIGDGTGEADRSFWDLLNGGREEDLDFSAFLQNFNESESAS